MTLDEFHREHQQCVIGDLIYGLVVDLAGAVCRKYSEEVYNGGLTWDDQSVSDLAQDVVLHRLIDEGQLEYIVAEATTIESVRRLIVRQVKRELQKRRLRTPIDRLLNRIEALAVAGEIESVEGAVPMYRPVGSTATWVPISPQQETEAVNAAASVPVLYSRLDSSRESQVFTARTLKLALEAFFSVAPVLTRQEIRQILEKLLTPWTPAKLVDIEDPHEIPDDPMNSTALSEIDAVAEAWVGELSDDECWVYYLRSRDVPDGVAAAKIGKSRPTVINIKKRVFERAENEFLVKLDPQHHLDAVRFAQEHCARRLGDAL